MSFFGRFSLMLLCTILLFTGCSYEDDAVKREGNPKPVKYVGANESMKLTQAKSLPVLKVVPVRLKQKESLEILQMQHQISFYRGSQYKKRVALTFDDGPDNYYTLQILDILKREHVKATFFVVGRMVKKYPASLKRIYREGHIVGNHSWNHPLFTRLSQTDVTKQVMNTNHIITQVIGRAPLLFRPPYGAMNKKLEKLVASKGYKIIYWNVDTVDWNSRSAAKILQTVKKELKLGSIILQHSAGDQSIRASVQALPLIIAYLKQQGYQFVTVDELIHTAAYAPSTKKNSSVSTIKQKQQQIKPTNKPTTKHKKASSPKTST